MTIIIDKEKVIKRGKWLQPESYLSELFIVICADTAEITDRVQIAFGQTFITLKVRRAGFANTWKLLDRAEGSCESLSEGPTDPQTRVHTEVTIALTFHWV